MLAPHSVSRAASAVHALLSIRHLPCVLHPHVTLAVHALVNIPFLPACLPPSHARATTHVLVPTDEYGKCTTRTMKYMLGVVRGVWVVSYAWADACIDAGAWIPEKNFEAKVGGQEGPVGLILFFLFPAKLEAGKSPMPHRRQP